MVIRLKIVLDHTETVLTAHGSEVSGTVVVQTKKPIGNKYKSLKIVLKGGGYATRAGRERRTDFKNYVNLEKVLWNERQSPGPDRELTTEEYHFPFQFTLHPSLPPSFEGGYSGSIHYYIIAHIFPKQPVRHNSYFTKIPLKVAEVIDINVPDLDRPVRFGKQEITDCLWCVYGPIATTGEVPRTGYCAGEEIPFRVTVENGSNRRVECVAKLLQNINFSTTVLDATRWSQPIEPHTTNTWESTLTVPGNTPVTTYTDIIKCYFTLVMSVIIPDTRNSVIKIPLIIGNVPYHQDAHPPQYSER